MVMFVSYPWPAPSANVYPAGFKAPVAASDLPDGAPETGAVGTSHIEDLVCWTYRERLRLLWYRLRLASGASYRASRRAQKPPLRLP